MSGKNKNNALVLVSAPEWRVADDKVKDLQTLAIAQLEEISRMENVAAMGAILCGLTLLRLQNSMARGEFGRWIEAASDKSAPTGALLLPIKRRQAFYIMSLAREFLDEGEIDLPVLLALPGGQLTLDLADGHDKNVLVAKIRKFCGANSLNELLIKHDIKSVGLKKALEAQKEKPEPLTAEQLYEQSRDEIGGAILRLENLLLTENRLQYLAGHEPDILGVTESLKKLAKKADAAASAILDAKPAKKKS